MISFSIFSIFSTNTPGPFLGILISFSQGEKETVKERERELIFPSKLNSFTQQPLQLIIQCIHNHKLENMYSVHVQIS